MTRSPEWQGSIASDSQKYAKNGPRIELRQDLTSSINRLKIPLPEIQD